MDAGSSEQLLCSPAKLHKKGFGQGCSLAGPQHADYYWGKVVQLRDRDAGSIPTGQTIPRLANPAWKCFAIPSLPGKLISVSEILFSKKGRMNPKSSWPVGVSARDYRWRAKGFVDDWRDSGFTLFGAPA
ncbi:MAG: hypothetical protein DME22_04890 [Verrucomicrobia bacterium]|nr:MAG: hypothetical protein DME22_04890 [Verrucomicrobiota bacterium]PYJ96490.1 MAG: hypothetical protein DME23_20310 [Verrucomicrobiota bacterium]